MELTHRFTVPATVAETWAAFNDIESVAGCFPGATVTSVEGDDFKGTCKVKLGPIALVYSGSGTFTSKDEEKGTFALEAKGKDKRGNGTAGANVTAALMDAGDGATEVEVVTDLLITGKPAQFGRGVIQDVSDKLLNQFVACLEQKLQGSGEPSEPPEPPATEPVEARPIPDPNADGARIRRLPPPETARTVRREPGDDALDLGATVLPVLARTYWKHALGLALVLFTLRRLLRRQ